MTLMDLQPELLQHVARHVHPNEVAGSLKLTCKAAAKHLANFTTVSCKEGQPVPAHALVWKWSQPEAVKELTALQRQVLAKQTIETGQLEAVQRLVTGEGGLEHAGMLGITACTDMLTAAASAGHLHVVQHLRQRGCDWDDRSSEAAGRQGSVELCTWLLTEPSAAHTEMLEAAAKAGHTDTCEVLLLAGCPWSRQAAGHAAAGGHVSLMRSLLQMSKAQPQQRHTDVRQLLCGGAEGLDLETLQGLNKQYWPQVPAGQAAALCAHMLSMAAQGHTADYQEKIDWLLSFGAEGDPEAPPDPWDYNWDSLSTCRGPHGSGASLVNRLRFLHQRRFKLGNATMIHLMTGQQDELEALAFMLDEVGLQARGSATMVANEACQRGRLGSLQLLQKRGWLQPTDGDLLNFLVCCSNVGQSAIAAWLLDTFYGNGPGQHPLRGEVLARVAGLGSVPLLQQLRERGCPWGEPARTETWVAAVYAGCVALLEWLDTQSCPRPVSWAHLRDML